MAPIINRLSKLLRSNTAKDSTVFFLGNFFNTTLSFIAVLIISRRLGPSSFGVLGVFNSIIVLIIGLTDLGLNTTSIRLISQYRQEDSRKAAVTMNVIVRIELLVGALILLVGAFLAQPVAQLLGGDRFILAVRLGFIAGAFSSAAAFFGPFFVSYRQYLKNALLNLASFILRTGLVLVLLATAALTLNRVMLIYTVVPILFFVMVFGFIPRDFLTKTNRTERRLAYRDVLHYSKWIFLSLVATGAISRLDLLFLTHFHGSQTAGYYYAAQQLIAIMPLIITALTTVLLQRVSQLQPAQYQRFLAKAFGAITLMALVLLPVLVLAPFGFDLIFGSAYQQAAGPFRLLFIGQLILLMTIPFSVWLLRVGQPRKITQAAAVQFLVSLLLYIVLIPHFGMAGAGLAVIAGSLASAIMLLGYASSGKLVTRAN